MATAALCGTTGSITGVTGTTEVTKWSITRTIEAIEATSMASAGWKERVACLKGATGNFTCIGTRPGVGPYASASFKTAAIGGLTISGAIIVTKVGVTTDVNALVSYDVDFTFTGAIGVA